jgi:hypothetical protein
LRRSELHLDVGISVEVDWFGDLPEAQMTAFRSYSTELEASFGIFSVSLDEAIGLHASGSVTESLDLAVLMSSVCQRFINLLDAALRSLGEHSKRHGTTPSVAPLNPSDFSSPRGQRAALASSLWHRALFSQHAQFLSKIRTLAALVANLGEDIRATAKELASHGAAVVDSAPLWSAVSTEYCDLNTCLRETLIMLKCFLRVLPDEQLLQFDKTLSNDERARLTVPFGMEAPTPIGSDKPGMNPCRAPRLWGGTDGKIA